MNLGTPFLCNPTELTLFCARAYSYVASYIEYAGENLQIFFYQQESVLHCFYHD